MISFVVLYLRLIFGRSKSTSAGAVGAPGIPGVSSVLVNLDGAVQILSGVTRCVSSVTAAPIDLELSTFLPSLFATIRHRLSHWCCSSWRGHCLQIHARQCTCSRLGSNCVWSTMWQCRQRFWWFRRDKMGIFLKGSCLHKSQRMLESQQRGEARVLSFKLKYL